MAAEARREARRRRILQNSDSRLQRILTSKTNDEKIDRENTETLSSTTNQNKVVSNVVESELTSARAETDHVKEKLKEETVQAPSNVPQETANPSSEDLRGTSVGNEQLEYVKTDERIPRQTGQDGNGDGSKPWSWIRVGLNVILGLLLVVLSSSYKLNQNFLIPWIFLQMLMFSFLPSEQNVSSVMSVIQVTLQLSGIPLHITRHLNNVYLFMHVLLNDLPVFVFGVVCSFELLKYISQITTG